MQWLYQQKKIVFLAYRYFSGLVGRVGIVNTVSLSVCQVLSLLFICKVHNSLLKHCIYDFKHLFLLTFALLRPFITHKHFCLIWCSVLADAAKGVRTPYLQLSAMQEGDYTFQLTVTDSAHQRSTAEVTLIVQPGKSEQAWLAPAGLAQPAALAPTPPVLAL